MNFKKTRIMNWGIAAIFFIGSLTIFLKGSSLFGNLIIFFICLLMFGIPAITAVSLSGEAPVFFGATILMTPSTVALIRKAAWVLNWAVIAYLLFGLVLFAFDGGINQMLIMVMFSVPVVVNLLALSKQRKLLKP